MIQIMRRRLHFSMRDCVIRRSVCLSCGSTRVRCLFRLSLLCLWLLPGAALAGSVSVLALFPGKALLSVDGHQRFVSSGQTTPEGVTLISADPGGALLRIHGRRVRMKLNDRVGGPYTASPDSTVRIVKNNQGMFTTTGSINGQSTDFIVDTGASTVAMSAADARRLGIQYRIVGTRMRVRTASGTGTAYRIMLNSVTVGEISLQDVSAVVIEGAGPPAPLLGMSFLGRLKMRNTGEMLILSKPF